MARRNTFKFAVSKAKPVIKKVATETLYATVGGAVASHLTIKKTRISRQNKKKKCLKKHSVGLSDSEGQKYKKLRDYNRCLK